MTHDILSWTKDSLSSKICLRASTKVKTRLKHLQRILSSKVTTQVTTIQSNSIRQTTSTMKISVLIAILCYLYQKSHALPTKIGISRHRGLTVPFKAPVNCVPKSRFLQRLLKNPSFHSHMRGGKCIVQSQLLAVPGSIQLRSRDTIVCKTFIFKQLCARKIAAGKINVVQG